jgi:hypothetical protein
MRDWVFDDCYVTQGNLTRAWNKSKGIGATVVGGIRYVADTCKYEDNYQELTVNDNHVFRRYPDDYRWTYTNDTIEYKESCIGDYKEDRYPLVCDAGSFVVNGLMFSNGVGDGSYPCIVRTFNSFRHYYTKADIYDNVTKVYPINGICRVNKYDCNAEDVYTFDNVKEIQIAQGKLYIIKVALGDNRGLFNSCQSIKI